VADDVNVLNLPMGDNDADARTVREYLMKLLLTVWDEKEGFSGKRPFGNSSWEVELYRALIFGGAIEGRVDADGDVDGYDDDRADAVIRRAIKDIWEHAWKYEDLTA
jgi:hypothetical protein